MGARAAADRHLWRDLKDHSCCIRSALQGGAVEIARGAKITLPEANPLDLANALRPFAILREKMGDFEGARAFWREARELYESLTIEAGVAEASQALARLGG